MSNYLEKKKKQKKEELRNAFGQTIDEYKRGTAPTSSANELRNAYGQTYEEYKASKSSGGNDKYIKWKSASNDLIKEYDDYSYSGKYMTQEKHDDYYKRLNEQLKQAASMREKYGSNVDEINAIVEKMSKQVQDNYEGRKYYSQWDDDETYQQFLKYQNEAETTEKLFEDPETTDTLEDFEEKSQYVAPKGLKSIFRDKNYEYINDTKWSPKYLVDGNGDVTEQEKRGYDHITDEERDRYNYIYNTQGKDRAEEYLEELNLTERMADKVIEDKRAYAKEHPVLASAESVVKNVAGGGLGFMDSAVNKLAGKEIDPNSYANLINRTSSEMRESVAEEIDSGAGRFFYQTGMSMADSVAAMAATAWTGPLGLAPGVASGFILGSNAATSAMLSAKERGVSDGQALATGIAQGAAEMLFEKYSIGELSALKDVPASSLKNVIGNILKQAGVEGSEEVFTSIANSLTDALINGDLSENKLNVQNYISQGYSEEEAKKMARKDYFGQLLMDFLGGAVSGGVMSGGVSTINYMTGRNQNVENENSAEGTEIAGEESENPTEETEITEPTIENQQEVTQEETYNEEIPWEEAEMYSGEIDQNVSYEENSEVAPAQQMQEKPAETQNNRASNLVDTVLEYGKVGDDMAAVIVKYDDMKKELEKRTGISITGTVDQQKNTVKEVVRIYGEQNGSTVTKRQNGPVTTPGKQNATVKGKGVEIIGIKNEGGLNPKFEASDGSSYTLDEVDFQKGETKKLYTNAAQIAMISNDNAANSFIEHYKPEFSVPYYSKGFDLFYSAGRTGVSLETSKSTLEAFVKATDEAAMTNAWNLGFKARQKENSMVAVETKQQKRKGTGSYADQSRNPNGMAMIQTLVANRTGIDITRVVEADKNANGMFIPSMMQMVISEKAENEYATLLHELGEFGLAYNREQMKELQDTFIRYWAEKNGIKGIEDLGEIAKRYQRVYKEAEGSKTLDQAMDELVNDALAGLFSSDEGVEQFMDWLHNESGYSKTEQKTIVQRLLDMIDKIVDYLKSLVKDSNMSAAARKAAELEAKRAQELRTKFLEVLEGAVENANTTGEYTADAAIKNSLKDFADQYDAWDGKNARTVFDVTVATDVYKFLGKDNKTIRFDASKIIKIKSKHQGMTDRVIKQIPEVLNNPILIMKSKKNNTRIVVTGMLQDENGKPVVVVLELEPIGRTGIVMDEIKVASAYGKDGMQNFINKSEILYTNPDKQIISRWAKRTRLQLPVGKASADYSNIVSDTQENATHEKKFSLAGVDALTADNDARIKAYQFEQDGKSELEIFKETGWYRGVDGKWRFEIDDSEAKVYRRGDAEISKDSDYAEWNEMSDDILWGLIDEEDTEAMERYEKLSEKAKLLEESRKNKRVSDYLDHPALFDAYPFIKNIRVNQTDMEGSQLGSLSMYDGINITKRYFEEYQELNLKKTLLHEIQHVIQHYERFAGGANTDLWKNIKITKNQKEFNEAIKRKNEAFDGGNDEFKSLVRKLNRLQLEQNFGEEYDHIENELYEKYEKRYMDYDNAMFDARMYADSEELSAFEKYEMTAGEIEARETENRSEWPEESRKNKLPKRTTDNGVIFRENRMNDPFVYVDESVSYSLNVDIDEEISYFGVENKLNDYIGVQKAVLGKLDNENFYTDVVNEATGIKISIGRKGIKETLSSGKRFQKLPRDLKELKIATIHNLPEIIKECVLIDDNVANIHGKASLFAYFKAEIEINDIPCVVKIDVKKTPAKNHFWIHHIEIEKKNSALLTSAPRGQKFNETQNSSEGILADESEDVKRFSLREDYDALEERHRNTLRENETYKELIESLESKLNIQKGISVSRENAEKVADKMYRRYKSTYDKADFADKVAGLFQSGETNKGNFLYIAEQIMRPVIENSKNNLEITDYAKGILRDIRKTTIKADGMQRNEAAYHYGTFNDYRKSLFGRVTFSDKGTSLDILWKQWSEAYPEWFDADVSPVDQPVKLAEIIGNLKEDYSNEYGFSLNDAVSYAAMELLNEYANLPEVSGMVDKAASAQFKSQYMNLTNALKKEYQETYEKQIAELKRENRNKLLTQEAKFRARSAKSRGDRIESQERRKYKGSIVKNTKEIMKLLETNSDKYHVPEILRDTTIGFLEGMDFISEKGWNSQDTIQLQNRLNVLYRKFSAEESNAEGNSFMQDIDPDFLPTLDGLISLLERGGEVKKIGDMNAEQLKEIAYLVGTLKRTIATANQLIGNKRFEQVSQLGDSSVNHMSSLKAKKHFGKWMGMGDEMLQTHMLDSFTFFGRMGEGAKSIHQEIRDGFNKRVWLLESAKKYMENVIGETKIQGWTGKKAEVHDFNYNGQKFALTTGQLMNLYVLSKRPQAFGHLMAGGGTQSETGGFTVDAKSIVKGQTVAERRVKVSDTQMKEMFERLTTEQKKMADSMQRFLAKNCSEWGNEVSMTLYGYKKFGEKTYWPIKTNDNFNKTDDRNANTGENTSLYAIRNQGMTKNLVKNANNPIVVGDIFDVFSEHVANMANYNAFVVPLTDAMKWYNYRSRTEEGAVKGSIKEEMERAFGKGAKSYFINFMKDVNGEVNKGTASEISDTFTSKYKAAAVGANVRTIVQQPTAYFRVASVMNPKYLAAGLMQKPAVKEMHENSAIAIWKSWGYFETGLGQSMKQVLTGEGTATEKIVEASMAGTGLADDIAWGTLWNAVKAEVKDKNKDIDISSEEYMKLVSERFDEIVDRTQVVDTVIHRSQIMRSQNGIVKMATAFMSEPTKSYNLLYEAYEKARRNDTKQNKLDVARKATVYGVTALATAFAASFIDAFRDDDEEKEYWKKWTENFFANAADNVNPLNMLPYLKELSSLWEGYDSSRMDMAGISSLVTSVQQLMKYVNGESKKNLYGVTKGLVRALSQVTGIPLYNAMRDTEALIEQFSFAPISEKELTAKDVRIYLLKAEKLGNEKQVKKYLAWYDAQYKEKLADGKTDKEAKSALKSSITSQYKQIYQNSTNAEKIKIKQLLLRISVDGKQLYKDYDWSSWDK